MGDLIIGGGELFEEVLKTMKVIVEDGVKSYTNSYVIEVEGTRDGSYLHSYYDFLFFKNGMKFYCLRGHLDLKTELKPKWW